MPVLETCNKLLMSALQANVQKDTQGSHLFFA